MTLVSTTASVIAPPFYSRKKCRWVVVVSVSVSPAWIGVVQDEALLAVEHARHVHAKTILLVFKSCCRLLRSAADMAKREEIGRGHRNGRVAGRLRRAGVDVDWVGFAGRLGEESQKPGLDCAVTG